LVRFAPHIAVALRLRETAPAYGDVESTTSPERAPVPDPFSEADALEELEEEIVTLAAHENALAHR